MRAKCRSPIDIWWGWLRLADPPDACDLASGGSNARGRLANRLDRDGHVKGIGMNEARCVAHNGDMSGPENEIAPLEVGNTRRRRDRFAKRLFLHVRIARTCESTGSQRDLHQPRAVEAEAGLASPKIRHTQKALGDCNEILLSCGQRIDMAGRNRAS